MNISLFRSAFIAALAVPASVCAAPFGNGNFVLGPRPCLDFCEFYTGSTAITDWTVLSGNLDYYPVYFYDPLGDPTLDMDGHAPGGIGQKFNTKIGQSYEVTFFMSANGSQHVPYDIVKILEATAGSFDDNFYYNISSHSSSDQGLQYVAESFEFEATSSLTQLSFTSLDNPNSWTGPLLGNVTVAPLPRDGEFQIHAFTGSSVNGDGATPTSQFVPDADGNLFGTTQTGGVNQCNTSPGTSVTCGTLFSLVPNATGTAFTEQTLYSFNSNAWAPTGRLTYFKSTGMLFGTALHSGSGCGGLGCGAVMQFTAPTNGASSSATVLFTFQGGTDGGLPNAHLLQNADTGVLYGTTRQGGNKGCGGQGCGVVFMLTPPATGSTWTETILYTFRGGNDGANPIDINMDAAGNIFGATAAGGTLKKGVAFKLTASGKAPWTENVVRAFGSGDDGSVPASGVIIDANDNLYGTTSQGGGSANCTGGCGVVYELSPPAKGKVWTETVLYRFRGLSDGQTPQAMLVLASTGALYGATSQGGNAANCTGGCGTAFELTAPAIGTTWKETILHRFQGGDDGANPMAGLHMDSSGRLYGTTAAGGAGNVGTAFQLQ